MNISQIQNNGLYPMGGGLKSDKLSQSQDIGYQIRDGFSHTQSTETLSIKDIVKGFSSCSSAPSDSTDSAGEVQQIGDKRVEAGSVGRVFRITEDEVIPITPRPDGGFLVEEDTGTVAYFGDSAKKYLENNTKFDKETEVILNREGIMQVEVEGTRLHVSEASAILIGPGAEAKVDIKEGNPMVITTEKAPDWYRKLKPEGEIQGEFDRIANVNKQLFACVTDKNRFAPGDLQKLFNFGIVSPDSANPNAVKWDGGIKDQDQLKSRLIEAGFQGKAIDENAKIWYNTIKRKLYATESGRVEKSRFSREQIDKMVQSGVARELILDKENLYWKDFNTEGEFRDKLSKVGVGGQEQDGIVNTWKKTTKSGYDNTGLAWDKGKVVAYILREKLNIWNEQDTEWIVNSTAYCGDNEPFTVGVSNVRSPQPYSEPVPFKDVRPKEVLHRHPVRDDKKQTEAYMVSKGEAVLLTMRQGKPSFTFMKPGDLAIISPGVAHCVLAVNGDYEHVCFQVPSAFQYGFLFKDELNFDSFSQSEKDLLNSALQGLRDDKHGTFSQDEIKKG